MTTVCLLEPYHTGSHRAWVEGYAARTRLALHALTMDGRFWKWRMHGGAVTLARLYRERNLRPDVLLATDMLDLTTFLALTRDRTPSLPVALYMHENQLTYPPPPGEKRDLHYGFINYASMLCADRVWFNSQFHLESWFEELPRLLKHFPDYTELATVEPLRARSEVLPLGLSLAAFDAWREAPAPGSEPLLIAWNHRWEYDKGPEAFFSALYALAERGVEFRVAVLGEGFVREPPEFSEARERLGGRIVQFGYAESFADYARWLWRADVVVSTAIQESFGAAVVEAMYCGCVPVLPDRLAYPQFIPPEHRDLCLYADDAGLVERLAHLAAHPRVARDPALRGAFRTQAARYDWSLMAPEYDRRLAALAAAGGEAR